MAPPQSMASSVEQAITAFAAGKPVMIFDSDFRERETDLLWPATAATPEVMRRLRRDCGGLLFLAIGNEIGELFGLPWLQDIHTHQALVAEHPVLGQLITDDLQYDTRSAFTLSLNHRETYTATLSTLRPVASVTRHQTPSSSNQSALGAHYKSEQMSRRRQAQRRQSSHL